MFHHLSNTKHLLIVGLCLVAVMLGCQAVLAQSDDRFQELERQLQVLEQQLQRTRGAGPGQDDSSELKRRMEILAAEIEKLKLGEAAVVADTPEHGFGPAASKVYRTASGVSLGGYGEMLYENFAAEREDGTEVSTNDWLDFLRAIIYVGYKFSDDWLFNSEIEFEHASTGKEGEASVEFAYLDYLWKPELNIRAGLLLMPMGLVNELHEPTVFNSTLRPTIERNIIPSTWRENGVGIFGDVGPFSYRSYLVNGMKGSGFSASGLRGGRQKGSKALANDFAWVGRLDYTAQPGLLAGGSVYVGNSGQDLSDEQGDIDALTTILEGHVQWNWRGVELRLLGTHAEVDDTNRLNAALELEGGDAVGERLRGGYVELAFDLLARTSHTAASVSPFFRWELSNTQHRTADGFESNPANDTERMTLGVAFKPLDRLVFKADFTDVQNDAGTGVDQFNLGMGYIF